MFSSVLRAGPRQIRLLARCLSSCPSCHAALPTALPACTKCSYISRVPSNTSYHHIFDLPAEQNPFQVDPVQLTNRFRAIQRVIHPDVWSMKGDDKQEVAASLSSFVNSAYKTLGKPLPRVEYILSKHDLETNETDALEDPELIMDVMEARENLELASSKDEVNQLRAENQEKIDELLPEIESLVEAKDWETLKTAAIKLKYLQGIDDAAETRSNES